MGSACACCKPYCPCCACCFPPEKTKKYVEVNSNLELKVGDDSYDENEKAKLLTDEQKVIEPAKQIGSGSFVYNYSFNDSNNQAIVILQHYFGESVSADTDNGALSRKGNSERTCQWMMQFDGESEKDNCIFVKFKNASTLKYLRIIEQNNTMLYTDCLGNGDKYSKFKVHKTDENLYKFESTVFENNYIGVNEYGVIVNNGDEFSNFSIWSDQKQIETVKIAKGDQTGKGLFVNPYSFNINNKKIIMKHYFGETLATKSSDDNILYANGDIDESAQFCVELDGVEDTFVIIKLKSMQTDKYVQIMDNKINCVDNDEKYTRFKVHKIGNNSYKFESYSHSNKYIGVDCVESETFVMVGIGDDLCEFTLWSDELDELDEIEEKKEEEEEEEEEEDDRMWYDNIEEISSYLKKEKKKNKDKSIIESIELSAEYWKNLNTEKAAKFDQILMELGEFVGVTNFDLRMTLWERVDDKRKKMGTLIGLEKLLYQLVIEYIAQKDKKRTKPQQKNVKTFMQYLAQNMVALENFPDKQKKEMDKEKFARGIDNWMFALIEKYKGE